VNFDLDYARDVIKSEAEAVMSVLLVVNDSFADALDLIYNCRGSVIVSGMGKAGIIGEKISATLASTGTPSHFLHPAEAIHGDLGRLRENDVVIVLSNGGETAEVTRLVDMIKKLSAKLELKMIAITASEESTLGKYSDVVLCMGKLTEACPIRVAPSVSTTCMLAIGDSLALTVMKARNFGAEEYVRFHPGGSLGAKLMTVEQSMMFKAGEELPIVNLDVTIKQMLEYTSKIKRHGAVMVVDADGKLTGIITDADIRRLMTKQGSDAFGFKAVDIMTAQCKRIRIDALAAEATSLFHKFRIDELPVVDAEDRPIGMIDVQDIVAIKVVG